MALRAMCKYSTLLTTAHMVSGRCSVIECDPTCAMTSKGPRCFSMSFLDSRVV